MSLGRFPQALEEPEVGPKRPDARNDSRDSTDSFRSLLAITLAARGRSDPRASWQSLKATLALGIVCDLVLQALSDSGDSAGESDCFWLSPQRPPPANESLGFPESLEGVLA
jgi:hypothetical protein